MNNQGIRFALERKRDDLKHNPLYSPFQVKCFSVFLSFFCFSQKYSPHFQNNTCRFNLFSIYFKLNL